MSMKRIITTVSLSLVMALTLSAQAFAHVVVKPAEVETASFTTFTIGVPNERDVPTTSVRLDIPDNLKYVTPTLTPGWTIDTVRSGQGESAVVSSITWSGSSVPAGFRQDFTFAAQAPAESGEIVWKAYQTYQDGKVVAWDMQTEPAEDSEDDTKGPASKTLVVAEGTAMTSMEHDDVEASSSTALNLAAAGLVAAITAAIIAIIALVRTTRR